MEYGENKGKAGTGAFASRTCYLSLYRSEELLAVLNFVDGYRFRGERNLQNGASSADTEGTDGLPEDAAAGDTVWIGLLQIDGRLRGRGWGGVILRALEGACRENGRRALQLGVIKGNGSAERFWKRQGFIVIDESENGHGVMEKSL